MSQNRKFAMIRVPIVLLLNTLALFANSCTFGQEKAKNENTIELRFQPGTREEALDQVLRFENIFMESAIFQGAALRGATYQLFVKEYKQGKLVGKETLFDGTEAAFFQIKEDQLSFRFLCKTGDEKLRLQISSPRFSSRRMKYDLTPSPQDYALKNFMGSKPFQTVSLADPFYLYAIIPPTLHPDGSGSYCEVAQSEVPPEELGSKFQLPHYFLVEMKFVAEKSKPAKP